jgi:hypothetical protein
MDADGRFHRVMHGRTVHGMQSLEPARRGEPLSYYHRTGPMGKFFAALGTNDPRPVAAVGLGAGVLAHYAQPGQDWTFYEIDPVVKRVAGDSRYFTWLRDSPGRVQVVLGDARLSLQGAPDGHFGLIILDAYSSDSIPIHLLTREALRLYLAKLAPRGRLVFHVSNLHLDLKPVVARLAEDAGLACVWRDDSDLDPEELAAGKTPSQWMVVGRTTEDLEFLAADRRWRRPSVPPEMALWTDDYSSILSVLDWRTN